MALKIRHGLEASRAGVIPEVGEFIYTTDTKVVYIGDGVTIGGNPLNTFPGGTAIWGSIIGTLSVQTDLQDALDDITGLALAGL